MELVGERNSNGSGNKTVYQTLHYGQSDNDDGKFAGRGTAFKLSSGNFNDSYHTFQLIGIKIILYGWLTIILLEKYIMDQII